MKSLCSIRALITLNWLLVNFEQLNESSLIINHRAESISSDVTKSFPHNQNDGYACNKAILRYTNLLGNVTGVSRLGVENYVMPRQQSALHKGSFNLKLKNLRGGRICGACG